MLNILQNHVKFHENTVTWGGGAIYKGYFRHSTPTGAFVFFLFLVLDLAELDELD